MFIIGGIIYQDLITENSWSDMVAQFKNGQWSRLANLNQGRMGHGAITIGAETMVIGGDTFPE